MLTLDWIAKRNKCCFFSGYGRFFLTISFHTWSELANSNNWGLSSADKPVLTLQLTLNFRHFLQKAQKDDEYQNVIKSQRRSDDHQDFCDTITCKGRFCTLVCFFFRLNALSTLQVRCPGPTNNARFCYPECSWCAHCSSSEFAAPCGCERPAV